MASIRKHYAERWKSWDADPHIVVPVTAPHPMTPERRLCWAIIESVMLDLAQREKPAHHRRAASPREEALEYMRREDPCWPYSFRRICEHLDIDPDAFLRRAEKGALLWMPASIAS